MRSCFEASLHAQPSPKAVGREGELEIVPSARANMLAAYLLSLKTVYDYPRPSPGHCPEGKEAEKK